MSTIRFLAPLLCFGLVAALTAQAGPAREPVFSTGDLAALDCKVVDVKSSGPYVQLLSVDVSNRGAVAAEPLEFQIEVPDKKGQPPRIETFRRVQLPRIARFGRPVPAGGKQSYVLATALPGKKVQFTVRVLAASFCSGGEVGKPEFGIGEPQQVQRTSLVGTFPVTQVELRNPFDRDVDVLMLVTLKQPLDAVELFGARLPANGKLAWVVSNRPGANVYLEPDSPPAGPLKATAFSVIDWSFVGRSGPEVGAQLLQRAYERWYRWPESEPQVAGQFAYRERRARPNAPGAYDDGAVRGRFTVGKDGSLAIEVEDGKGVNPRMLLEQALENVRRPDFATFAKHNVLVPITGDRVGWHGPGWEMGRTTGKLATAAGALPEGEDLQVEGDRIASSGYREGPRTVWQSRDIGGSYVVTRRRDASTDTSYSYQEQDGRIVPTAITQTTTFGDTLYSAAELLLTELNFDAAQPIEPVPPQGEGAAALRAMWDAAYRLPVGPIVISADFEVVNPGTDLLWRGHKKLRGSVVMTGIGRHLRHATLDFAGDLAPEMQMTLAAAIRDRWLMWYGRDFNDRAPFDEFFRSAVIHAPVAGDFVVESCHVDKVVTHAGLVTGWRLKGGGTTKFTWQKFGERQAVVRIDEEVGAPQNRSQDRWSSSVVVTLAKFGEVLLPTGLLFEHIFGRDWGPESIVFKNLKVR